MEPGSGEFSAVDTRTVWGHTRTQVRTSWVYVLYLMAGLELQGPTVRVAARIRVVWVMVL